MHAALLHVRRLQGAHELDRVVTQSHELHPHALAHVLAVFALARDPLLIPRLRGPAREEVADAASEPTLLGLDEMADDLVDAPLAIHEVEATAAVAIGVHPRLG